jgi:hypothetical protein
VAGPGPKELPKDPTTRSLENLHLIALAMRKYHDQEKTLPPAAKCGAQSQPLLSWRVLILPYLGQDALYKRFRLDEPWDSPANKPLAALAPDVYKPPEGLADGKTCYLVPVGLGTPFYEKTGILLSQIVSPATTILVVEADADRATVWTQPEDLHYFPAQPSAGLGGTRGGKFLAGMADGTAHVYAVDDAKALAGLFSFAGRPDVALEPLASLPADGAAAGSAKGAAPGMAAGGGAAAPAAAEKDAAGKLIRRACEAVGQNRGKEALSYFMAAGVAQSNADVLGKVRWVPALKRPALAIRWGIALHEGNKPNPVRPANGRNERKPPAQPAPAAMPAENANWQALIIQPLVQRLEAEVADGDYGDWSGLTAGAKDGSLAAGAAVPAAVAAPGPAAGLPTPRAAGASITAAGPAISMLGSADAETALQLAARDSLDVVVLGLTTNKPAVARAPEQSSITLRLLDVATRKMLWESRPLGDQKVQAAKQQASGGKAAGKKGAKSKAPGDPAGDLVDELLHYAETNLKLIEMPAITAEVANKRAGWLADQEYSNPLAALLELRYYQWKQLLTPEETAGFYAKILGDQNGPKLATGSDRERLSVVGRLLP